MPGSIEYQQYIRRYDLKARPEVLFVFGDNLARLGYGGQAKEMRDEPNAVGVPTKRWPSWDEDAFYAGDAEPGAVQAIDAAFAKLEAHLIAGGTVVFPADGIGTGRAQLRERAPLLMALIHERVKRCQAIERTR